MDGESDDNEDELSWVRGGEWDWRNETWSWFQGNAHPNARLVIFKEK